MTELPSGTVTFLFTDIEGSTRLWQEHPEGMQPALARHDELVRDAIETHGGYVVKTTGDGAHAAFATASDAVDAAVAAQLAIDAEAWTLPDPLRVRMGLHSGPAELRDGDYYGTAVNRAARIMSIAHGGQIVVSHATHQLGLDLTVEVVDLGEHRLKDLGQPERIFQVVHPELARDFPPLRSLDRSATNLPLQATSFVGRDDEVARIVSMLDDASLVTLMGTGGVGKTRLAIQVAAEVVPRFADGAWFCELAAVDDGDSMVQVVATTLGCVQRPGLSLLLSVVEYVKVRSLLLVLDNCEHLLDEAGELADAILRACPDVTVLTTSREALDLAGERVVRVRPLDAPDSAAFGERLLDSAAVRLFADRAADAGASTAWNDAQWAAVGEICRRIDGIPLAIELAAARAASMSPTDIAAHLDERFRLLTGKRRGKVERQQTLRATVEWSYQLLTDDERRVFDRFGVFAGTFSAGAAAAVAGGDDLDAWQVTDAISSLVAKSMLVPEEGPDDASCYAMLETLRHFARERLDEAGETDRWRLRHAAHYAEWTRAVAAGIRSADEVLWLGRLRAELDNVRAAVGWALDREVIGEQVLGVRMVAELADAARGFSDLGIDSLAAAAVPAADGCEPDLRSAVRALAAHHLFNLGRPDDALALARSALDGNTPGTRFAYHVHMVIGILELSTGDVHSALETMKEGRAEVEGIHDNYAEARFLEWAVSLEAMSGSIDDARRDSDRLVQLAHELHNPSVSATALFSMAWVLQRDEPAEALRAAEESAEIARGASVMWGSFGTVLAMLGSLRARLGDLSGALDPLSEAVRFTRDQGSRPQLAAALDWSINPLVKLGRLVAAATLVGALNDGSLSEIYNFPGVDAPRARSLERVRSALGDEATDAAVARGAGMPYDDLVAYALEHLRADETSPG